MKYCPICGYKVDISFDSPCTEPFAHYYPMSGLLIYGPFSSGKQIICHESGFLHFVINGTEHRLVQLGVTQEEAKEAQGEWQFEHDPQDFASDDNELPF